MRFLALILLFLISFTSCKSSKLATHNTSKSNSISKSSKRNKAHNIVTHAKTFNGTKYKFGGTTKRGMDCSGLIYVSFKNENILLPRVSKDMATKGVPVILKNVQKGDLLFFHTNKNKRIINHVGLVTRVTKNSIEFIHSTSSRGVIISFLSEHYWKSSFKEARRFL